jgi:2-amino-4-hydroxy-6-hydroxymethyldihydropteridine diphosphokinase
MTRAGVALGSNVDNRIEHLRRARAAISDLPELRAPLLASAVYETEPVDCDPGCEDFLNAVIEIGYAADAPHLLRALRAIETQLGRPTDRRRNAPRTVDLDLLYFGDAVIDTEELRLPHPRMHERAFVLRPLSDIRPELILPSQTASVAELAGALENTPAVVRSELQW